MTLPAAQPDAHFPAEEAEEAAALVIPCLISTDDASAILLDTVSGEAHAHGRCRGMGLGAEPGQQQNHGHPGARLLPLVFDRIRQH